MVSMLAALATLILSLTLRQACLVSFTYGKGGSEKSFTLPKVTKFIEGTGICSPVVYLLTTTEDELAA